MILVIIAIVHSIDFAEDAAYTVISGNCIFIFVIGYGICIGTALLNAREIPRYTSYIIFTCYNTFINTTCNGVACIHRHITNYAANTVCAKDFSLVDAIFDYTVFIIACNSADSRIVFRINYSTYSNARNGTLICARNNARSAGIAACGYICIINSKIFNRSA